MLLHACLLVGRSSPRTDMNCHGTLLVQSLVDGRRVESVPFAAWLNAPTLNTFTTQGTNNIMHSSGHNLTLQNHRLKKEKSGRAALFGTPRRAGVALLISPPGKTACISDLGDLLLLFQTLASPT